MININSKLSEMRTSDNLGFRLLAKQIDLNSQTPSKPPEVPEFWNDYHIFLKEVYNEMVERNRKNK